LFGLNEHAAPAGKPEQVSEMLTLLAGCCCKVILKMAGCPALIVTGAGAFAGKWNGPTNEKFAVTSFAPFMVTLQDSVPVHAPPQPAKVHSGFALAESVTTVPSGNVERQVVLEQLRPVPVTTPAGAFEV
jgi:hypothetical protein